MRYLSLDIGNRRTGVAFADTDEGIPPISLETISHQSFDDLADQIESIVTENGIHELVLGLPLLPSGDEGAQAGIVRDAAQILEEIGIPLSFVDERYSTAGSQGSDPDASAAIAILDVKLSSN